MDELCSLSHVNELSLLSNPVSRRLHYRTQILCRLPHLSILDGVVVSEDERMRIRAILQEQEVRSRLLQDHCSVASTVYSVASILYGVDSILYGVASILYGVASILYGVDSILYGVAGILYSVASIL